MHGRLNKKKDVDIFLLLTVLMQFFGVFDCKKKKRRKKIKVNEKGKSFLCRKYEDGRLK